MARHPTARQKVLDASRQIVMQRGAGSLTFEEIAQVSGVTRGGITYHFPTKQHLLKGLIADDLEQWKALDAELRPDGEPDERAALLAFLRSHTHKNVERRRFVTGMLSAASLDPPILDPVRQYEARRLEGVDWDDHALRQQLLRLAAMGLFWSDVFGCPEYPEALRAELVRMLETLAVDWTGGPDADAS